MKIAVLTSGGDAPGMNAAIRAVVRAGIKAGHDIIGIKDGYFGLINEDFITLDSHSVSGMLNLGGTFLGTARLKEFKDDKVVKQGADILRRHNIDALVVIGGDGTYKGAYALYLEGIKTIGIPVTIDNDIYGTDYTIGFSTAVGTIVDAIDKLRDTSASHRRCSIVEVMGRENGDLALHSGICGGAEFIITADNPVNKEDIIEKLKAYRKEGRRHAIIVITEKLMDVHKFAEEISEKSGFSSRATVLGYIQRGGSPSPEDRILASRMGAYAINLLDKNISGVAIGVNNANMINLAFSEVINKKRAKSELYSLVNKVSS